jgi:hypothetical protein
VDRSFCRNSCPVLALHLFLDAVFAPRFALPRGSQLDGLEEVFRFDASFWYVPDLCGFLSSIFPFQTFAVKFFRSTTASAGRKEDFSPEFWPYDHDSHAVSG